MNTTLNMSLLETRLAALEQARPWSPNLITLLGEFIKRADDEALLRVNPLRFAADHDLTEQESIDLFLFATKLGLFQMEWLLFCSLCGCIVDNLRSLDTVHSHYRCEACAGETDANLDDYIAVYFQISPGVRPIVFHSPHLLSAELYYFTYKYSTETFFHGGVIDDVPHEIMTRDYFRARTKLIALLRPGEERNFELEVLPDFFALNESANKGQAFFLVDDNHAPAEQTLRVTLGDFPAQPMHLGPGKVQLQVKNDLDRSAHVWGVNLPMSLFALRDAKIKVNPLLLGSRVLTTATFKALFRNEVIASDEGIGIRNMTLLFSDLKGSTDLYDAIGDLKAFTLVREHFEQLGRIIDQHAGVVVKTIGDAVMAAFINPLDAMRSACLILQAIADFNDRMGGNNIILKLGVHQGAVIAVTLNDRIDYFGQSVNIAARVQGLAEAEEVCLTDSVYEAPGVAAFLDGREVRMETAKLKGVAGKITVYRLIGAVERTT